MKIKDYILLGVAALMPILFWLFYSLAYGWAKKQDTVLGLEVSCCFSAIIIMMAIIIPTVNKNT